MTEQKRRKVIMDVDTGSDDAMALIAAMMSPQLDVIGVCTVNGNREVKLTTLNTLRVMELLDSNVPVYRGCEYPLVACLDPKRKPGIPQREGDKYDPTLSKIHGDHLPLPDPITKKVQPVSAVAYYLDVLMNTDEKITLVPVGPLTNLALAMQADSRICENIDEIVIMGGGHRDHDIEIPFVEWNVWIDPEAAEIVLQYAQRYGYKVTWVPLDATDEAYMTVRDAERMRKVGSPIANAMADFIQQRAGGYEHNVEMKENAGAPVHDALAVLYLINPDVLVDVRHVHMQIDLGHGCCDGMTCIDLRPVSTKKAPNCYFAFHANRELFCEELTKIIENNTVYSK